MKPDWKDAPKWANWLAMDSGGSWFWYENKPFVLTEYFSFENNRTQKVNIAGWENTLQERPK